MGRKIYANRAIARFSRPISIVSHIIFQVVKVFFILMWSKFIFFYYICIVKRVEFYGKAERATSTKTI